MRLFVGVEMFFTIFLKNHGLKSWISWTIWTHAIVNVAHVSVIIWLNHRQLNPQEIIGCLCHFCMVRHITATNDTINSTFVHIGFVLNLSFVLHFNLRFQFRTNPLIWLTWFFFQHLDQIIMTSTIKKQYNEMKNEFEKEKKNIMYPVCCKHFKADWMLPQRSE